MTPSLPLFLILLFLTGPPDADTMSTVSRVTVQRGRSVSIPCHYHLKYKNNVKYWCHGRYWCSCSFVVRTDSPKNNGKVSITDDPTHQVFTVSMKSLQDRDSGYYWCAVEIGGAGTVDDGAYLYLTVSGTPGLWVDQQEVTGVEGGNVSVLCHYSNHGSMKKWCRSGGSCVPGNSGKVRISDNSRGKVFTVTVSGLKMQDAGWYWCAAGDLQIPVHITVTLPTTTVTTMTESSASQQTTAMAANTSLPAATAHNATQMSPTVEHSLEEKRSFWQQKYILITSGTLLLVVAIAMVTWKVCSKHREIQDDTRGAEENDLTTTQETEVIYSTVNTRKKPRQTPSEDAADEIIYSSVVLCNPQPRANPDNAVVYSSVVPRKMKK